MKEKERELQHDNARFLIVKVQGTNYYDSIHDNNVNSDCMRSDIVSFTHFRFEPHDEDNPNEELLYVYELQTYYLRQFVNSLASNCSFVRTYCAHVFIFKSLSLLTLLIFFHFNKYT